MHGLQEEGPEAAAFAHLPASPRSSLSTTGSPLNVRRLSALARVFVTGTHRMVCLAALRPLNC